MAGKPLATKVKPETFAWLLKDLRRAGGYTTSGAFADAVHVSDSYVRKVDGLRLRPARTYAVSCDSLLGTNGQLTRLWDDVDWSILDHPDWFRTYAAKEAEALRIRGLHTERIPGLLQTADYARALVRHLSPDDDPDEIEQTVQARLLRQARFLDPDGPELVAIVDEGVIWQHVGGRLVMRDQLDHLLNVSERHPNIQVHIAQRELGEQTGNGGFHLLSLPNGSTLVYAESLGSGRFITDAGKAAEHSRAYDRLRRAALNGTDSAAVIRRAMRELVNVTTTPVLTVDWRQPPRDWKTSTYSQGDGGECVEVAANVAATEGVVPVRDSKDRQGPVLEPTTAAWAAFLAGVRAGDFGTV
ncbi:Scr1 family TA system antitoxin-like transcriptional regulator [Kitasatospora sp. NPDC003701]